MKSQILVALLMISFLCVGFGGQPTYAAEDSPIDIYVLPGITDEKILPSSNIADSYISNQISIVASPGEYEPASFVIRANADIAFLMAEASDLAGETEVISSSNVDIRVVKCWYQAGRDRINEPYYDKNYKELVQELLLKNDSLVRVENGENYLVLPNGEHWISEVKKIEYVFPGIDSMGGIQAYLKVKEPLCAVKDFEGQGFYFRLLAFSYLLLNSFIKCAYGINALTRLRLLQRRNTLVPVHAISNKLIPLIITWTGFIVQPILILLE